MEAALAHTTGNHTEPYTAHDLLELDDGWHRFEVLDGALLVTPPPPLQHQIIADSVRDVLRDAAPPGLRVVSAVGVRLRDDGKALVPDVVVVQAGARGPLLEAEEVAAAVEIVSPSSRSIDRVTKPTVYATAGIPCYWRVEQEEFPDQGDERLPVVLAHALEGDCYRLTQRLPAGKAGQLDIPFPVEFDPAQLWE